MLPVRPFTIGARVMRAGRYGAGSADDRLVPFSLRRQSLVRGAEGTSYDPRIDPLVGSRMLSASLELRFPILGLLSRRLTWGGVPLEGLAFADAGTAWNSGATPAWFGGHR